MAKKLSPRPEVRRFAEAMERVLRNNDDKCGWHDMSLDDLIVRFEEERLELFKELGPLLVAESHYDAYRTPEDKATLKRHIRWFTKELIDVSNFAMMLYDAATHYFPEDMANEEDN